MFRTMKTEPTSLGSVNDLSKLTRISKLSMLTSMLISVMALVTVTSIAAHASTPTLAKPSTVIQSADRAAAPGEFKVRAVAATKNETKRLTKTNRVAKKKAEVRTVRNKIVKVARNQIGDPYRAGRSGPNAFDCSGLVRFVYKQVTGKTLPHFSKAQYRHVTKVKKAKAQPGDLVFFFEKGAHHVGIYIGKGKMIDAPNAGAKVRVSPISGSWWGRSYTGMGRLLSA